MMQVVIVASRREDFACYLRIAEVINMSWLAADRNEEHCFGAADEMRGIVR